MSTVNRIFGPVTQTESDIYVSVNPGYKWVLHQALNKIVSSTLPAETDSNVVLPDPNLWKMEPGPRFEVTNNGDPAVVGAIFGMSRYSPFDIIDHNGSVIVSQIQYPETAYIGLDANLNYVLIKKFGGASFSAAQPVLSNRFDLSFSGTNYNVDIRQELLKRGWDATSDVSVFISVEENAQIGSRSNTQPAMSAELTQGSNITMFIGQNAIISGKGGDGSEGRPAQIVAASPVAEDGGPAIKTWSNMTIVSYGSIHGGGGGGSGGVNASHGGGGGGGGAGLDAGRGAFGGSGQPQGSDGGLLVGGGGGLPFSGNGGGGNGGGPGAAGTAGVSGGTPGDGGSAFLTLIDGAFSATITYVAGAVGSVLGTTVQFAP